jgi:hypothetical protein
VERSDFFSSITLPPLEVRYHMLLRYTLTQGSDRAVYIHFCWTVCHTLSSWDTLGPWDTLSPGDTLDPWDKLWIHSAHAIHSTLKILTNEAVLFWLDAFKLSMKRNAQLEECSAVQCSAVQCSAVQCSAVQCSADGGRRGLGAVGRCRDTSGGGSHGCEGAVQCSAVQCSAVQCSAVRGGAGI